MGGLTPFIPLSSQAREGEAGWTALINSWEIAYNKKHQRSLTYFSKSLNISTKVNDDRLVGENNVECYIEYLERPPGTGTNFTRPAAAIGRGGGAG
jgi:hypothetical protein